MFKVGDKIVPKNSHLDYMNENCDLYLGQKVKPDYLFITSVSKSSSAYYQFDAYINGVKIGNCDGHQLNESTADYYNNSGNTNNKTNMSLTTLFKSLSRTEPNKSFVKAGIMDNNNDLTSEGKELFIQYMFDQNADAFNTAVAQPIIAAQESDK